MSLRQMTRVRPLLMLLALAALSGPVAGQGQQRAEQRSEPYGGLTFRNIGPASMAGRVDDLAVSNRILRSSTSAPRMAASGKPRTTARPSKRSSRTRG